MDIKVKLRDLIVLQDRITHLNAKGLEDSAEAKKLCLTRDALRNNIVVYVDQLDRWAWS